MSFLNQKFVKRLTQSSDELLVQDTSGRDGVNETDDRPIAEALQRRISTRAFLPTPVPQAKVQKVLEAARWAPSGGNLQPWRVIVVAGEARQRVIDLAAQTLAANPLGEPTDRPIYPPQLWEPFRTRRFEVGEQLYALLGIERADKAGRFAQIARNFQFFDAPVGLFFVIDARMGHGQWAHLGMFMLAVALAAQEEGLATCMQEAWGALRPSLKAHFQLDDSEMVYAGLALGHADPAAAVNHLRSPRVAVEDFTRFDGF